MIQRIQSIFLLLAALACLGTAAFRVELMQETYTWLMPAVLGVLGLVALGALVSIFLYKDRQQQLKMTTILQYVAILGVLAAFGGLYLAGTLMEVPSNLQATGLLLLPVFAYVFIRIARGYVKKDIALVRSMDRLR
ncbi:MAG: DUF4293 family protein [Bacteroidota bacterium]